MLVRIVLIAAIAQFTWVLSVAQTTPGLKSVLDAGSLVYSNPELRLTLSLPPNAGNIILRSQVNEKGGRARVLDAYYNSPLSKDEFYFAVLVDFLEDYPDQRSPERYLRSLGVMVEKEGFQPIGQERGFQVSGARFVRSDFKAVTSGGGHFRSASCAMRSNYMLCFDVTAPSQADLDRLLDLSSSLKLQ